MDQQKIREILEKQPGILVIGAPNIGKRTLLSRLLSVDFEDLSDSSSEVLVQGCTINTKYYSADVSVWMAHLHNEFSAHSLPNFEQLTPLVMVFGMNDLSTLAALKEWVSRMNIQDFDILLCIGNKVDLIPGHRAHTEYRRRLLKQEDSYVNSDADFTENGISETEGTSLLESEEPSWEGKRSFSEWFTVRNIEFIEACASNADFDKCKFPISLKGMNHIVIFKEKRSSSLRPQIMTALLGFETSVNLQMLTLRRLCEQVGGAIHLCPFSPQQSSSVKWRVLNHCRLPWRRSSLPIPTPNPP